MLDRNGYQKGFKFFKIWGNITITIGAIIPFIASFWVILLRVVIRFFTHILYIYGLLGNLVISVHLIHTNAY